MSTRVCVCACVRAQISIGACAMISDSLCVRVCVYIDISWCMCSQISVGVMCGRYLMDSMSKDI